MLPFTKRPGRGDESGDNEVVTKDDISQPELARPDALTGARAMFSSLSDDEMTNIMPSKSIGEALSDARQSSPRPAAGAPATVERGRSVPSARPSATAAPSSRASAAPSASRSGRFAAVEDEDDGRTVVRGAPKIVKRTSAPGKMGGMTTMPTTVSPAAVIKATLESARAGQRKTGDLQNLMAPPPANLLEDLSDFDSHDGSSDRTALLQSSGSVPPPGMVQGVKALPSQQAMSHVPMATGSSRSLSAPPPPHSHPSMGGGQQSGGYSAQSGGYSAQSGGYSAQSGAYSSQSGGYAAQYSGAAPAGPVSVAGASMPAHFMVPQSPYSEVRVDPPGTAVTARTRIGGRPAKSWALALVAFGAFVGIGAFAVMRLNGGGLTETTAAFVDPSRVAAATMAPAETPAPTPTPVAEDHSAVAAAPAVPAPVAPAANAAPPPASTADHTVAAAAPAVTAVKGAVPAAPAAAPPAPVKAPVAQAPAPAPYRPAPPPPRATAKPVAEEPVASTPTKATPASKTKPAGKAGGTEVDEETKKALEALQKSQLESSF